MSNPIIPYDHVLKNEISPHSLQQEPSDMRLRNEREMASKVGLWSGNGVYR
jgi:hypothetical protein